MNDREKIKAWAEKTLISLEKDNPFNYLDVSFELQDDLMITIEATKTLLNGLIDRTEEKS